MVRNIIADIVSIMLLLHKAMCTCWERSRTKCTCAVAASVIESNGDGHFDGRGFLSEGMFDEKLGPQ